MIKAWARSILLAGFLASSAAAFADDFSDARATFQNSSEARGYFASSYGYAIFPTIGEGGFVVAGGHGTGRVYVRGRYVGDASVTQVSVGAQAGAQAYSEIIFFENRDAFRKFTSGNYSFGAEASAVAITASAEASAATQTGANAGAGINRHDAGTLGGYHDGLAVFTIVKGGAMAQAAVAGQKFGYTPKGR